MTMLKKFALAVGVATGVLGMVVPFAKHGPHTFELLRLWPGLFLDAVVLFIVPGLLVAFGSYLHTLQGKTLGLVMLLIGGIFLAGMSLIYFFGGAVFYVFGLWGGVVVILQSLMAILTVGSSLVVHRPPDS